MNYHLTAVISGLSILPGVIIGLVRYKKVLRSYRPFIIFMVVGLVNELTSFYTLKAYQNTAFNANVYVLIEFLLLLWLFKNFGLLQSKIKLFSILAYSLTIIWIVETLIINRWNQYSSIYRICYSLVLVYLSVDQINFIISSESKNIARNAKFIICAVFVVYFTYKAIIEIFFFIELGLGAQFYKNLYTIIIFLNILLNLLYALASLWIPRKQKFSLPYL